MNWIVALNLDAQSVSFFTFYLIAISLFTNDDIFECYFSVLKYILKSGLSLNEFIAFSFISMGTDDLKSDLYAIHRTFP